jgi:hypothetical protein
MSGFKMKYPPVAATAGGQCNPPGSNSIGHYDRPGTADKEHRDAPNQNEEPPRGTSTGDPHEPRLWRVAEAVPGEYVPDSLCGERYRPPRRALMAVTMTALELEWATPTSTLEEDGPLSPAEQRLLCKLCVGELIAVGGTESCEELEHRAANLTHSLLP